MSENEKPGIDALFKKAKESGADVKVIEMDGRDLLKMLAAKAVGRMAPHYEEYRMVAIVLAHRLGGDINITLEEIEAVCNDPEKDSNWVRAHDGGIEFKITSTAECLRMQAELEAREKEETAKNPESEVQEFLKHVAARSIQSGQTGEEN